MFELITAAEKFSVVLNKIKWQEEQRRLERKER